MSLAVRRLIALGIGAALLACHDQAPDIAPAAISVTPASIGTIASGATVTLHASVTNGGGSVLDKLTVSWQSDDPSIAAVSASGVVSGVGAGDTHITASIGSMHSVPV